MTFQDFWKRTKKITAIGVETLKFQIDDSDDPLKDEEFLTYKKKFKKYSKLIKNMIQNFVDLKQKMRILSNTQKEVSKNFLSVINITESHRYNDETELFHKNILQIIQSIDDNGDIILLNSKKDEIKRLSRIEEKLENNLLLKAHAEDKITNLTVNGTQEKRQIAQAEFDKRYENTRVYNEQYTTGINKLANDVDVLSQNLSIFYQNLVEKFVSLAASIFIHETVSAEAFLGSPSDEEN